MISMSHEKKVERCKNNGLIMVVEIKSTTFASTFHGSLVIRLIARFAINVTTIVPVERMPTPRRLTSVLLSLARRASESSPHRWTLKKIYRGNDFLSLGALSHPRTYVVRSTSLVGHEPAAMNEQLTTGFTLGVRTPTHRSLNSTVFSASYIKLYYPWKNYFCNK